MPNPKTGKCLATARCDRLPSLYCIEQLDNGYLAWKLDVPSLRLEFRTLQVRLHLLWTPN
jgi:hypothetical protein